jgi:hypothetical protein
MSHDASGTRAVGSLRSASLALVALAVAVSAPSLWADGLTRVHPDANPAKIVDGEPPFEDAPAFRVITRKKDPDMHPCGDCHDDAESDFTPRELAEPHDNFKLEHGLHGRGEFWCFTCHRVKGAGGLKTLEKDKLGFDEAYVVCAQCHSQEARDWTFGAHGKRVEGWQGERTLLSCTVCHFQHRPAVPAREPLGPPPMRRGLERVPQPPPKVVRVWERYAAPAGPEGKH